MSYVKLNGTYKRYDFGGRRNTSHKALLKEFDKKLELVLDKIKSEGTEEQQEYAVFYRRRADELRTIVETFKSGGYVQYDREILGRSIQSFDDLLAGRVNEENNQQSLLLARDLGQDANLEAVGAAFIGLMALSFLVISLVFAIPSGGLSLLFLIDFVPYAAVAGFFAYESHEVSKTKEKATSFIDASHSMFSKGSGEGGTSNPLHHEDEHDEQHGADGDKSRHHKND
ncbi:MAG: phage holin family protein [Gammaproteobacteria bacterium]|nr:phage holin family protein [Gammaproteobacteria bacterium]